MAKKKLGLDVAIIVFNWTWGIFMSLIGAIATGVCMITGKFEIKKCANSPLIAVVLKSDRSMGSATLGMFCISGKYNYEHGIVSEVAPDFVVMDHEWGHTIQNAIVGPFMAIVAICSVVWCGITHPAAKKKDNNVSYYSYWTEKWANYLGKHYKDVTLELRDEFKEVFDGDNDLMAHDKENINA